MSKEKQYADLVWTPEDVLSLRPNWSYEKANDWLAPHENAIRDRLCELGWVVMGALMIPEDSADAEESQ